MGVELSSDADLSRRIDARKALSRERRRLKCKRCKQLIPESRRADSLYCSPRCHRSYRWEQITALRTEMRGTYRELTAPKVCKCGKPLDNRPGKHAPVKTQCNHCRWAKNSREARRRKREQRE